MARIVLVHGAWGCAESWGEVPERLEARGHRVEAVDLPGHGDDPAPPEMSGLDQYAEALSDVLKRGVPAVLVGHSMGGMAISAAAERVPGQVRHLVYVAAFLPRDGDSLLSLKKREPETIGAAVRRGPARGTTVLDPVLAAGILFQDASEEQRRCGIAHLGPQSNAAQTDPVRLTDARFGGLSRSYVLCSQDRTITPWLQERMIKDTPCNAVRTLDCGHFPQLTQPEALADIIADFAERA